MKSKRKQPKEVWDSLEKWIKKNNMEVRGETILQILEDMDRGRYWHSKTDEKIMKHREKCKKWTKEFCLECFGGGTHKVIENYGEELRKKWLSTLKY